jgi:hypothetical protein
VINLYCQILLKNNHPRDLDRHTFFHIPAVSIYPCFLIHVLLFSQFVQ